MNNFYSNNEFDINKFNKKFDKIQNVKEEEEQQYLDQQMKIINEKNSLKNMRLGSIFSRMKDEVFGTIYDMLSFNYENSYSEIFTKNNRLFYIGIFLIIICIILYFISYLFFYPKPIDNNINLNANIGIPDDYKLRYYPYNKQDSQEIIENRKTIDLLKKKLIDSKLQIKELEKSIPKTIPTQNSLPRTQYQVDNAIISSDNMPPAVKQQIQNPINDL